MQTLHHHKNVCGALVIGVSGLLSSYASAETLETVLSNTYLGNPEINSERANLRALDEENPRARAGYRPNLNFEADIGTQETHTRPPVLTDGRRNNGGYAFNLVQPIFRGLRTLNSIRQADANIYAGREDLRGVEQRIFLNAVTAFVDVIRDRAIARLRRNNVSVIAEQLRAANDRFAAGEVTKTDVAQAKARHSGAVSDLNFSQANLKTSRAVFEQIIGHNPNGLQTPRAIVRYLPQNLNVSLQRGGSEHPDVLSATYRELSADYSVKLIRGELLPEVNLEGSFVERFHPSIGIRKQTTTIVRGTFRMPLYAGGEISARVRQAKQVVIRRRHDLQTAQRRVRADIIASWGLVSSNKARLNADRSEVNATKTALEGVREEEKVGQRTVLDVLDAQQELLNAQVSVAITSRDLTVSRYRLLAATGRLSAVELGLKVEYYEPGYHYDHVKRKWFGRRVEEYDDEFERRAFISDKYFPKRFK